LRVAVLGQKEDYSESYQDKRRLCQHLAEGCAAIEIS
jgi:hypothetical protein